MPIAQRRLLLVDPSRYTACIIHLVMTCMGNRGEGDREAIAASIEAHDGEKESVEGEGRPQSRYVHEAVGVPNDPEVIAAIDAWADTWADEIYPVMKDEGLYDANDPAHVAAMEKMNAARDALKEVLPSAQFLIGYVSFDGGHVSLSI